MAPGETDLLTRNPWVTRRRLTVAEYHRMGEAGILTEDDHAVKRALYARHGIPEFGIVNLAANEVEVCRTPTGEQYASVARVWHDGVLEPESLPGVAILVAALLG